MAYGPLALKPDEFERLQPYELLQLYEGYQWRQDNEALFYGYFFLPIANYLRKKEYRYPDHVALAAPLLSQKRQGDIRKAREASLKQQEEQFKKKFPEVR